MSYIKQSKSCDQHHPHYASWQVDKWIAWLIGIAPSCAVRPEDEIRSAAYIVLRDKAKVSAVRAHCMVITERKIHLRRYDKTILFDEVFI